MRPRPITRRRLLATAAGTALGASFLGGCAHGPGGSPEGSFKQVDVAVPNKYAGRKVVMAWHAFGGGNGKAMNKLTQKFNESQSDIYLDMQYQGSYDATLQKLTASLQSGFSPDMVTVSEGSQGKLELQHVAGPLNDFFDQKTLDRFNPVMLDQWKVDGQISQIPFARSTPLLYFNRDLYAKIGLPDRGPKTWTEFMEWAEEIHKYKNPQGDPMLSMAIDSSHWEYQGYVWQFGGTLSKGLDITVNQGGAVDAAQYFRTVCQDKKYAAVTSQDTFNNGFAAAGMYSTASIATVTETAKFRLGVDFMPAEVERAVPTGGSGWTVPNGIDRSNKEAAAEVIKFFAQPENAAFWTVATGYVPIVTDAASNDVFKTKAAEDPNYLVAVDQLKYARSTDDMRSFVPGSSTINGNYISLIYQSDQPLQSVLDRWQERFQRAADNVRPQYDALFDGKR